MQNIIEKNIMALYIPLTEITCQFRNTGKKRSSQVYRPIMFLTYKTHQYYPSLALSNITYDAAANELGIIKRHKRAV